MDQATRFCGSVQAHTRATTHPISVHPSSRLSMPIANEFGCPRRSATIAGKRYRHNRAINQRTSIANSHPLRMDIGNLSGGGK